MRILSLDSSCAGGIAGVEDATLLFGIPLPANGSDAHIEQSCLAGALTYMPGVPDIVSVDGAPDSAPDWLKQLPPGRESAFFSSPRQLSCIIGAFGMSPYPRGTRCYALHWDELSGGFYEIDEQCGVTLLADVLSCPAERFGFIDELASVSGQVQGLPARIDRLAALACFSSRSPMTSEEENFSEFLLARFVPGRTTKDELHDHPFCGVGIESQKVREFAGKFSDRIFSIFHGAAAKLLLKNLPLVISGSCGMNPEWNAKWRDSGLFSTVFVPPSAGRNAAIGRALHAQLVHTGSAKVRWSVYSGQNFDDGGLTGCEGFERKALSMEEVAAAITRGDIIGWIHGRSELGDRSLGNRSIIASPFDAATKTRLNRIIAHEEYQPVAAACLEEDLDLHFESAEPAPYMEFLNRVRSRRLAALSHPGKAAWVQSVTRARNEKLASLLEAFRDITGCGVLCNVSLRTKDTGLMNDAKTLLSFVAEKGLDGFVIEDAFYRKQ